MRRAFAALRARLASSLALRGGDAQSANGPVARRGSILARLLLVVYVVLVAYAGVYPFSGWRDPGISPLAFVWLPWPRYLSVFDVLANVAGYAPLGALCVAALYPRWRGRAAIAAGTLAAGLVSLAVEATQSFLPTRYASNLDLLCNIAGAFVGALAGARLAGPVLEGGVLRQLRERALSAGLVADLGLALLAVWLFAQLNPATLLFGMGDLRDALEVAPVADFTPGFFVRVEAATVAANLVAVALLASLLARRGPAARWFAAALICGALCVRSLAFAVLMGADSAFAWLTRGAQLGLAGGALLAWAAMRLPRGARHVLAALLVAGATALVNLAPSNPYFAAILQAWPQGHFLNFNGLTRLVSAVWPLAALAYLAVLARGGLREGLG